MTAVEGLAGRSVAMWRAAGEDRNAAAAVRALSPDVRMISPATAQYAFVGHLQIQCLLDEAFKVITSISYVDQMQSGSSVALFYRGTLGGTEFEEAQRLRLNGAGQIEEVTLFLRPLPALTGLMHQLGPALARRADRPRLASILAVAGWMLHQFAEAGERSLLPRTRPASEDRHQV